MGLERTLSTSAVSCNTRSGHKKWFISLWLKCHQQLWPFKKTQTKSVDRYVQSSSPSIQKCSTLSYVELQARSQSGLKFNAGWTVFFLGSALWLNCVVSSLTRSVQLHGARSWWILDCLSCVNNNEKCGAIIKCNALPVRLCKTFDRSINLINRLKE